MTELLNEHISEWSRQNFKNKSKGEAIDRIKSQVATRLDYPCFWPQCIFSYGLGNKDAKIVFVQTQPEFITEAVMSREGLHRREVTYPLDDIDILHKEFRKFKDFPFYYATIYPLPVSKQSSPEPELFAPYLIKTIELINPDAVVFLGSKCWNNGRPLENVHYKIKRVKVHNLECIEYQLPNDKKIKFYKAPHPFSMRSENEEDNAKMFDKMFEVLKTILGKAYVIQTTPTEKVDTTKALIEGQAKVQNDNRIFKERLKVSTTNEAKDKKLKDKAKKKRDEEKKENAVLFGKKNGSTIETFFKKKSKLEE